MKNPDFLSYFSNLIETNSKEEILKNANNIINSINTKEEKDINKEKYKDYLKLFESPSQDLLYTFYRIIGGLCSTGIEYRKGFAITFQLLIDKFSKDINFSALLDSIQKESYVPNSEKKHIKICANSGKIIMYKVIINQKNLSEDNILFMLKQIFMIEKNLKSLQISIIVLLKEFLDKILNRFYDIKKDNKLFDELFKFLDSFCENKNNLNKSKSIFEFTLYFILIKYKDNFKGFLPSNIINELFDSNLNERETPIKKYFDLLLSEQININKKNNNEQEFHISFNLLTELLIKLNEPKYSYKIWNILIDQNCIEDFKKISQKNFEFLIFSYSKFLISKFFNIDYITQIFDDSFFLSLLKFSSNKKIKYTYLLTELISETLNQNESNAENDLISNYCFNLLKIFGNENEEKFSPNKLNNFFIFLFSKLKKKDKEKYINSLIDLTEEDIEKILFNTTALKILFLNSNEQIISKELKNKILDYFLIQFYSSSSEIDITFNNLIEEKTILLILSLIKPTYDGNEVIPMKSSKVINILIDVNKKIQDLIKNKKIEVDSKQYLKYFKILSKENNEIKTKLINKIGLILLIPLLKDESTYTQDIEDLITIVKNKFDKLWMKVYTDTIIDLLNKTNSILGEFIINEFKKMSKYIGKDGIEVIIEFLKDTKVHKIKEKIENDNEEEKDEDEDME